MAAGNVTQIAEQTMYRRRETRRSEGLCAKTRALARRNVGGRFRIVHRTIVDGAVRPAC
jgi:hypothetical protein